MILSNVAIHKAIEDGDIIITPDPSPRFNTLDSQDSPYDATSVNLRLGPTLNIAEERKPFSFDLRVKGLPKLLTSTYRTFEMDERGGFSLEPNLFVLGNTFEKLSLPVREGHVAIAGRVEGKSSFARCGLLVHFTAPTIHANFTGPITLEILNLGKQPIQLFPGMLICQIVFERVEGIPQKFALSQFQGQTTPAGIK